jgi:hypothetical protein
MTTQDIINKIGQAGIEHQAKIEDVKDSLMNKDWIVQGYFQKTIIVLGFFSLIAWIIKLVMWLW